MRLIENAPINLLYPDLIWMSTISAFQSSALLLIKNSASSINKY